MSAQPQPSAPQPPPLPAEVVTQLDRAAVKRRIVLDAVLMVAGLVLSVVAFAFFEDVAKSWGLGIGGLIAFVAAAGHLLHQRNRMAQTEPSLRMDAHGFTLTRDGQASSLEWTQVMAIGTDVRGTALARTHVLTFLPEPDQVTQLELPRPKLVSRMFRWGARGWVYAEQDETPTFGDIAQAAADYWAAANPEAAAAIATGTVRDRHR